jgi:hypothetical protein
MPDHRPEIVTNNGHARVALAAPGDGQREAPGELGIGHSGATGERLLRTATVACGQRFCRMSWSARRSSRPPNHLIRFHTAKASPSLAGLPGACSRSLDGQQWGSICNRTRPHEAPRVTTTASVRWPATRGLIEAGLLWSLDGMQGVRSEKARVCIPRASLGPMSRGIILLGSGRPRRPRSREDRSRLGELQDDLDVVRCSLQRLLNRVRGDAPGHQLLQPRPVRRGQCCRGAIVVTPVGVDRAEHRDVVEYHVVGQRGCRSRAGRCGRADAGEADDAPGETVPIACRTSSTTPVHSTTMWGRRARSVIAPVW